MSSSKRFVLAALLASVSVLSGLFGLQFHGGHATSAGHGATHVADGSSPWPPPQS